MPTTFVYTSFAVLCALNNAGQLAPVDKADMPPGIAGPIQFTEAACNYARGRMASPEKYVCQVFTGPSETQLVYQTPGFTVPAAAASPKENLQPGANPEHRSDAVVPGAPDENFTAMQRFGTDNQNSAAGGSQPQVLPAPKPKRVAQQPRYQRQAMFEGNPLAMLFNW